MTFNAARLVCRTARYITRSNRFNVRRPNIIEQKIRRFSSIPNNSLYHKLTHRYGLQHEYLSIAAKPIIIPNFQKRFHNNDNININPRNKDYFYNYRQTQTKKLNQLISSSSQISSSNDFDPTDTKRIFHAFSTYELLKTYILFQLCSSKLLTTLMIRIMNNAMTGPKSGLKSLFYKPLISIVRNQYFPLFTGGETIQECVEMAKTYSNNGIHLIIDNSTEEAYTIDAWNRNAQNKKDLIQLASNNLSGKVLYVPLKMTGLTSAKLLEYLGEIIDFEKPENGDPVSIMSEKRLEELDDALDRLSDIISFGISKNIAFILDAEQYTRQNGMNYIARRLSNKFNKNNKIWIFNTYQMYLQDAKKWVLFDLNHAKNNNYSPGIKLVRGAYLSYEINHAKIQNRSNPIQQSKGLTDESYNDGIITVMEELVKYYQNENKNKNNDNNNAVGLAICTHNRESIEIVTKEMKKNKFPRNYEYIIFAQLKGMADNLTFGLGVNGYNALKLIPYGDFDDVWPYLMRRLEENQDMLSGMATEKDLYWTEIKRRIMPRKK